MITGVALSSSNSLLDTILEPGSLSVVFQPIFEVSGEQLKLFALEHFIRGPQGTNLTDPLVMFEYARHKRAEILVDQACLTTILQTISEAGHHYPVTINVQAATISRLHDFPEFLLNLAEINRISPARLTLEIVETSQNWDTALLRPVVQQLRSAGIRIALSGFGGHQSNYHLLLECEPDFIKPDACLIRRSGSDRRRRRILQSMAELAREFNVRIIATGIEQTADYEAVTDSGITLVQGFLFAGILPAGVRAESETVIQVHALHQ